MISGKDEYSLTCKENETVLSLKTKLMEEEGIATDLQFLYFGGYWLSSDDAILGNFLKPGDELDLCLMKADEKFVNDTFDDTFIIHGPKQNFSINMIDSRMDAKIKCSLVDKS